MKLLLLLASLFLFTAAVAAHTITQAEYFIDTDPGAGNGVPLAVTPGGSVQLADSISVDGLSPGLHKLFVRIKRDDGVWTDPATQSFRTGTGLGQVDEAELYFDSDPGMGNGIALPVSGNGTIYDTSILLPPLGLGPHTVYVRNRVGNTWADQIGKLVRVRPSLPGDSNMITQAEIFFGSDPGPGNGCQLTADDSNINPWQTDAQRFVSATDFSLGQHLVYGRMRDALGQWTALLQDTFSVIDPHASILANVDTVGTRVRVFWSKYPAATEYHLHYDSVSTGDFVQYYTIAASDTSILLAAAPRMFFYVLAVQPEADEPCPPVGSVQSQPSGSEFIRP